LIFRTKKNCSFQTTLNHDIRKEIISPCLG
jgi:hypothetical protein